MGTLSTLTPDEVFELHPKIRWAALSTRDGKVVFCKMRPGLTSYTPESNDKKFMEFGPQMIAGIAERLSGCGGKPQSLSVNLEKDSVFITLMGDAYLAISADRDEAQDVFEKVEPMIRRL